MFISQMSVKSCGGLTGAEKASGDALLEILGWGGGGGSGETLMQIMLQPMNYDYEKCHRKEAWGPWGPVLWVRKASCKKCL